MGSRVQYGVLGRLQVRDGERDLSPRGALQRRLLCALVLHRNEVVRTDVLAEILWPGGLPADHHAALQTHVFRLRQALGDGAISSAPAGYRLHVERGDVDAQRFEAVVYEAVTARPRDPEAAVALLDEAVGWWRGVSYEELGDHDDARIEGARLGELHARAHEERFDCLLDLGRHDESVGDIEAFAARHPLRERPQAQLMSAFQRGGRTADALAVYERYRRALAEDLGIDPSASLRQLHDDIVTGTGQGPTWAADPVATRPAPTDPTGGFGARYVSSFVGRDSLVTEVVDLLARERLVTLLGTGGVGKSRVAVAVCEAMAARTPERQWFCELAPAEAASVTLTVAAAVGVEERTGTDLVARIAQVLRAQPGLVVLDNCEHVLDVAAELAEAILAVTPGSRILATSRERLAVDGEHLCAVPPLPRPTGAGTGEPAIELFVDRARAVRPGWEPDDGELAVVAEVCRHLDGLPLALELAAARLHTLTLAEVSAGLERRFRLLTGGRRTTARHRSLAAAVAWSYDLLDEDERAMFDVLAVFQSPFPVAGAAALRGCSEMEATDLLSSLVERSLVQRVDDRYSVLETLRQFAVERLDERGETRAVRSLHARYHIDFADGAAALLRQPGVNGALDDLDASLGDLRTAHQFLVETAAADDLLRLVMALRDYGLFRMRPEVLGWAEDAIELLGAADPDHPRLGDAYAVAGLKAWKRGDIAGAEELTQAARRAADAAQAAGGVETFLGHDVIGNQAMITGRLDEAVSWYERTLIREAAHPDALRRAETKGNLLLARSYANAPGAVREADELVAGLGDDTPVLGAAWILYAAGEALADTDPPAAAERFRRSMELAARCGAAFVTGVAGVSLASIEARHGEPAAAITEYRWLLAHWQRAGVRPLQWTMLRAVAELLVRVGCDRPAGVLLGAIATTEAGHGVFGDDARRLASLDDQLRERLGADEFDRVTAEGQGMSDDDAVTVALAAFDQLG